MGKDTCKLIELIGSVVALIMVAEMSVWIIVLTVRFFEDIHTLTVAVQRLAERLAS